MPPILHLSLPVADLAAARDFYVEVLGCRLGRERDEWLDVWFYGLQLTLQHRPEDVLTPGQQGTRHFGVALDLVEFEEAEGGADYVAVCLPAFSPDLVKRDS